MHVVIKVLGYLPKLFCDCSSFVMAYTLWVTVGDMVVGMSCILLELGREWSTFPFSGIGHYLKISALWPMYGIQKSEKDCYWVHCTFSTSSSNASCTPSFVLALKCERMSKLPWEMNHKSHFMWVRMLNLYHRQYKLVHVHVSTTNHIRDV